MSASHERALQALLRRGRLRELQPRRGLDFASNDYLALAESEELRAAVRAAIDRGVPVGAGGSRLLRGNHEEHEALELEASEFFGGESALFFGGGFIASTAIFSTVPARGDLIVYDEFIHASAHEGMRLSKAESVAARHNDLDAFERVMASWRKAGGTGRIWIAVESLYSMDGDSAPLDALASLVDRHDAMLVIDEAHATGVFGPKGRGLGAALEGSPNVISLHTCGKALGVMGALVVCPRIVRDFLVNRARSFIYATAPSPLVAATVRSALQLSAQSDDRRDRLQTRIAFAGRLLDKVLGVVPTSTQIQPIILGSDTRAVALASALQERGFDIRAIRPPTVSEGTARLRLTLTLNTSETQIEALIGALAEEQARLAA